VVPDFDSNAMNEIGFRRDRKHSLAAEDFAVQFGRVREEALTAESEGPVQTEAETLLLDRLKEKLESLLGALGDGEVLVVESEQGLDYPKARDRKEGIIVEGENRIYFHWRVDPPLRVGVYRRTSP
jgi:hypothetical protein